MDKSQRAAELARIRAEFSCKQDTPLDQMQHVLSGVVGHFLNLKGGQISEKLFAERLSEAHQIPMVQALLPHIKYSWDGERIYE